MRGERTDVSNQEVWDLLTGPLMSSLADINAELRAVLLDLNALNTLFAFSESYSAQRKSLLDLKEHVSRELGLDWERFDDASDEDALDECLTFGELTGNDLVMRKVRNALASDPSLAGCLESVEYDTFDNDSSVSFRLKLRRPAVSS